MKKLKSSRLSSDFYNKEGEELAIALLGKVLCRRLPNNTVISGYIVETEAYLGFIDKASQTYNGRRTDHNEPLYMDPGTCYVYMTYGMYHCMNISSKGDGSAVLIRAVEPLNGIEHITKLRSKAKKKNKLNQTPIKDLCNGPAKFCMGFDINKKNINKEDLSNSNHIWIEEPDCNSEIISTLNKNNIVKCPRIGIESAGREWADKPMRFYIKSNIYVSKKDKNEITLE
ncbi:uncharacterized protein LOC113366671 [Ctenocephalides felis]|uniref:uncharacterized protein LOC113366671 n=1 Tax=Ctenocephalides felis TaxID=7515 RepID=UPI000E6E290C|nr:uncharacterized protein LOC113366671 [Ctenocephalides felis]